LAPAIALGVTLPALLLPDGRLWSRRRRVLVATSVTGAVMALLLAAEPGTERVPLSSRKCDRRGCDGQSAGSRCAGGINRPEGDRRLIKKPLFTGHELREHFASRRRAADEAIQRLDPDALLGTPTEDLAASLVEEYTVRPLHLHADRMEQLKVEEAHVTAPPGRRDHGLLFHDRNPFEMRHSSIDGLRLLPAARVSVAVPFDGDPRLFHLRASTRSVGDLPHTHIEGTDLVLTYTSLNPTPEQIKGVVDRELGLVQMNVEWINQDVREFSARFPGLVRAMIEARKARLLRGRGLEGALGIPVRRRPDAPTRPVPVTRKRMGLQRGRHQPTHAQPYRDEPVVNQVAYEEILDIIVAMGRAFERSPTTFARLREEELRDHFLIQLNGTFEGQAGGELFNGAGRTDILVRVADRNVFIGECKFWTGPKAFERAVAQLLSYLVWRDTKAALVLFIRQQDATAVIDRADVVIRAHPNCKRPGPATSDPQLRRNFILHQAGDPNREIHLALLPVVIRQPRSEPPNRTEAAT
jgi:hypothetical protein